MSCDLQDHVRDTKVKMFKFRLMTYVTIIVLCSHLQRTESVPLIVNTWPFVKATTEGS